MNPFYDALEKLIRTLGVEPPPEGTLLLSCVATIEEATRRADNLNHIKACAETMVAGATRDHIEWTSPVVNALLKANEV